MARALPHRRLGSDLWKDRNGVSSGHLRILVAMWIGTIIAGLVMAAGFRLLAYPMIDLSSVAAQDGSPSRDQDGYAVGTAPSGGEAKVDVEARHVGNLQVEIEALVKSLDGEPLSRGRVVAYTDMTEMPGAHVQGPLRLTEDVDQPGLYAGRIPVTMPGDYEVNVRVREPIRGEASKSIVVSTVQG